MACERLAVSDASRHLRPRLARIWLFRLPPRSLAASRKSHIALARGRGLALAARPNRRTRAMLSVVDIRHLSPERSSRMSSPQNIAKIPTYRSEWSLGNCAERPRRVAMELGR